MRMLANTMVTALFLMSFNAFSDHWTSPGEVSEAAHELDATAGHFARVVRQNTGYSHLSVDATRLARSADHLHSLVEGGADYFHIQSDWQRVQQDFSHLEHAFERAHGSHHDRHLENDFREVESAYGRLDWAMTRGTGGGGGRVLWECSASDSGWEEHFGGHTATGYDQFEAQQNAIRECQRYHGRCRANRCTTVR